MRLRVCSNLNHPPKKKHHWHLWTAMEPRQKISGLQKETRHGVFWATSASPHFFGPKVAVWCDEFLPFFCRSRIASQAQRHTISTLLIDQRSTKCINNCKMFDVYVTPWWKKTQCENRISWDHFTMVTEGTTFPQTQPSRLDRFDLTWCDACCNILCGLLVPKKKGTFFLIAWIVDSGLIFNIFCIEDKSKTWFTMFSMKWLPMIHQTCVFYTTKKRGSLHIRGPPESPLLHEKINPQKFDR